MMCPNTAIVLYLNHLNSRNKSQYNVYCSVLYNSDIWFSIVCNRELDCDISQTERHKACGIFVIAKKHLLLSDSLIFTHSLKHRQSHHTQ